jgi:hypothetical protein
MKTRKKYGGSELVHKQLDDCVKETKVLINKLEITNVEKQNYIERNAKLDILIQQFFERNVDLDKRNVDLNKQNVNLDKQNADFVKRNIDLDKRNADFIKRNIDMDKRLKITEEKLKKVTQNFLENRVISAIFDVIKTEKYSNSSSNSSSKPRKNPSTQTYSGNPAYQNIDQSKLRDMRNGIAHFWLGNIIQNKPLYDQHKKYLFEQIKKLQQEKLPIVEYINEQLIDLSFNKSDPIFDLNTFMNILATETASVSITPEIMTKLDKWWNHGII